VKPLYARSGVPEVWRVDLTVRSIAVRRDPAPGGYRTADVVPPPDHLSPVAFSDLLVPVDAILG